MQVLFSIQPSPKEGLTYWGYTQLIQYYIHFKPVCGVNNQKVNTILHMLKRCIEVLRIQWKNKRENKQPQKKHKAKQRKKTKRGHRTQGEGGREVEKEGDEERGRQRGVEVGVGDRNGQTDRQADRGDGGQGREGRGRVRTHTCWYMYINSR